MELFARHMSVDPFAANDDAAFLGVDLDVFAGEAGNLGGQDKIAGGLEEIDWRRTSGGVGADDLSELFMPGQKITKRIPAGKRHGKNRSMFWWPVTVYATIARIYSHNMASSIQAT